MDTMLEPGVRLEPPGLLLTRERLDEFLEEMRRKGLLTSTLDTYRRNIAFLYDALPEDKTLRPGTLDRWQRDLLAEGYSPRTVNTRLSVANPRCLKRLWQATQDSVRAQLDTLVEQACISLLETEQLSIGWDSSRGVRGP